MLVEIIVRGVNRLHLDSDVKLHSLSLAWRKGEVAFNVIESTPELPGSKVMHAKECRGVNVIHCEYLWTSGRRGWWCGGLGCRWFLLLSKAQHESAADCAERHNGEPRTTMIGGGLHGGGQRNGSSVMDRYGLNGYKTLLVWQAILVKSDALHESIEFIK